MPQPQSPPKPPSPLKDQTAIAGIGWTPFTKASNCSVEELAVAASEAAIADAGLTPKDIDGLITYGLADTVGTGVVATGLSLPNLRHYADYNAGGNMACGNMACGVVTHAAMAVFSGLADTILVYRALNGASGIRYGGIDFSRLLAQTSVHSDAEAQFLLPQGIAMPAHEYALMCRRHMLKYGTTYEQLGAIAVTSRRHAQLNPRAQMQKPLSLETYMAAPWIADPFRKYDCCLQTDGGVALIVTRADRARDLAQPAVLIRAGVTGTGARNRGGMWGNHWDDHAVSYAHYIKDDLYSAADIVAEDVNVAGIYDCFSYSVLVQLEDFGFCEKGEGGPFVESGAIGLGGRLPVNTAGGLLSEGYIHGLNSVLEVVSQLRGQAGQRQVANATVGLATAGGAGTTGSAIVLKRDGA